MGRKRDYRSHIKEETIVSMLYHIRAQIVRDGRGGLPHVDALLRWRGLDPYARHIPRKYDKRFKRGKLQLLLIEALRDSPKTGPELADWVSERTPGLTPDDAYYRVYACLARLRKLGDVHRERHVYSLVVAGQR